MNVLVDTTIWSLALRRASSDVHPCVAELSALIGEGRALLLGAIRQELLSGVREVRHFKRLRDHLRPFPDIALEMADYEEAASCSNRCRAAGVQGSGNDFLICAVALRRDLAVYTTDGDFIHYARVLEVRRHAERD